MGLAKLVRILDGMENPSEKLQAYRDACNEYTKVADFSYDSAEYFARVKDAFCACDDAWEALNEKEQNKIRVAVLKDMK